LFEDEQCNPEFHAFLISSKKLRGLKVKVYQNFTVDALYLPAYLNSDFTKFEFFGKLLKPDVEKSIIDQGIILQNNSKFVCLICFFLSKETVEKCQQVFNSTLKGSEAKRKSKSSSKSPKGKKSKKTKKDEKEKCDKDKKRKAKMENDLKALKKSAKVAKAIPDGKKVTLSGKVLEQENSKKLKIKTFDPFQGMPENWLSDFEFALQKASLDPA
jgi:hypothetical protein